MSQRGIVRAHVRRERRSRRRRARASGLAAAAAAVGVLGIGSASAEAASFQVTSKDDSGPRTLRQAIASANLTATPDTITFASSVTGKIDVGAEMRITSAIDIKGPGAGALTLDGGGAGRLFSIGGIPLASPSQVAISGLTMTGGYDGGYLGGGAILASLDDGYAVPHLTISDSTITGNKVSIAQGAGVGVRFASLVLDNVKMTDNDAAASGDGIGGAFSAYLPQPQPGGGPGISITDSTLSGNSAGTGGAGFAWTPGGQIAIDRTTISGNSARDVGGLSLTSGGSTTISNSTISGNVASAAGSGGGLSLASPTASSRILDTTIEGNRAQSGGGVAFTTNTGGPLLIEGSTISGNTAAKFGGGLYRVHGAVKLRSTIVAGNRATGAGAAAPTSATRPASRARRCLPTP